MSTILQILTVMIVSAGFFWGGIPLGLTMNFSLLSAGVITIAGAECAVIAVLLLGTPVQNWIKRRFPLWIEKTTAGRVGRIWQSYGLLGLGFVSPILPGAPQSAVLALALGARPVRIFLSVSVGILFWAILTMTAVALGYHTFASEAVNASENNPGIVSDNVLVNAQGGRQ
ncbi:MAG: hypothetical protein CVV45_07765 [Spirochaetae bacterium HGW-Spirochaetae-10]|nr:MAG: hypothetical protein CVV45_07765 [Spirochaetae bacterium HGW-Spirochaetae-10]